MVFEPQDTEQGVSNFEVFLSLPRFEISCSIFEISNIFGQVSEKVRHSHPVAPRYYCFRAFAALLYKL
jgi:hypothetical protein